MERPTNEELVERARSIVRPRKIANGKLIADVGAALVSGNGNVYAGICFDTQEGNGICAERAAMAAMVTAGESRIERIVAVWTDGTVIPPCGACREWMGQLDKKNWNTEVLVGRGKTVRLKELLPYHWHNPDSE